MLALGEGTAGTVRLISEVAASAMSTTRTDRSADIRAGCRL
jgi:hypothetical protein